MTCDDDDDDDDDDDEAFAVPVLMYGSFGARRISEKLSELTGG